MSAFLTSFPEIRIDATLTDATVDLIESGTDVAIRIGALPDSTLVAKRLAGQSRILVAAPGYIKRIGLPVCPRDLTNHSCLFFTVQTGSAWYFRPCGKPEAQFEKLSVSGAVKANDSEALLEATLSEIGLALLSSWLIGEDIKAGKLVRVLEQFEWVLAPGAERAIWAVYSPKKVVAPKVKSFINFMARQLKDSLG